MFEALNLARPEVFCSTLRGPQPIPERSEGLGWGGVEGSRAPGWVKVE